jgi:hypothetical protein
VRCRRDRPTDVYLTASSIRAHPARLDSLSSGCSRAAVAQNNQVLCPLYASPALLSASKAALVELMGKEEALDIMKTSPMILTCGSDLRDLKPSDIRSTANTRRFLDTFFQGPAALGSIVAFFAVLKVIGAVLEAYG